MKLIPRFLLLPFFIFSVALVTSASADDTGSSTTTTTTVITSTTTTTHNADGSTTTLITNSDGSSSTTIDKSDGTTITTKRKADGSSVQTIDNADGSSVITTHNADGSSSKLIEHADGSWTKTATTSDGKTTTETSDSTSDSGSGASSPAPSSSSSPAPGAGSSPSPEESPTPEPTPSVPLAAPFDIDMVLVWMAEQGDKDHLFYMSASCITGDQWAAFLNAVAKFTDKHGLYNSAMADEPKTRTDFHGHKIISRTPQIICTPSSDGKGTTYSVVDRDKSAGVLGMPSMTNKDLPITYVTLVDAARFCNWLHHGLPTFGESENPDDATEGGAYLIDEGFDAQYNRYDELRSTITLLPGALWRLPAYYHYVGVHHSFGSKYPDFTEPGGELSSTSVPIGDAKGFFDNYPNIWLWEYAHYELTSTHHCTCVTAQRLYSRAPAAYGNYYELKSPTDSQYQCAYPFVKNILTHLPFVSKNNDTGFRVMPIGNFSTKPISDTSSDQASPPESSAPPAP